MSEVAIALLQRFPTSLAEPTLAGNAHASIERSIRDNASVSLEVVETAITHFEDSLVDDVLIRPARTLDKTSFGVQLEVCPYRTPNFSSFILFGTVSTTCSFTDSTAAAADCIVK